VCRGLRRAIRSVWALCGRPIRLSVVVDGTIISSLTAVIPPPDPRDPGAGGDWGPGPSLPVVRGDQHLSFTLNSPTAFLGADEWGDGLILLFGRSSFLRRRVIAELIIVPLPDAPVVHGVLVELPTE
jgi:hypothetical protein